GHPERGRERHRAIPGRVLVGGRRDTCRESHGHGKSHRGGCEFSGRSDAGGDLVGDRPPGDRGPAEIEGRKPLQPLRILDVHGLVQAEQLTNRLDRKSTRLNSSHLVISYAVFCLKKKNTYLISQFKHLPFPLHYTKPPAPTPSVLLPQ